MYVLKSFHNLLSFSAIMPLQRKCEVLACFTCTDGTSQNHPCLGDQFVNFQQQLTAHPRTHAMPCYCPVHRGKWWKDPDGPNKHQSSSQHINTNPTNSQLLLFTLGQKTINHFNTPPILPFRHGFKTKRQNLGQWVHWSGNFTSLGDR
jgi:hypothetical protein